STTPGVTITYDRGNLTQYAAERYTWDGLDRMSSYSSDGTAGSTYKYSYDGSNERVVKISSATSGSAWYLSFRDEANRIATAQVGGTPSRDEVFLGQFLVASYANCSAAGNCR